MDRKRIINLIIGPALFLICAFLLPETVFTTFGARAAIGTIAWMAYWWITAPIDYAVTGFLPIAVNAICQLTDMNAVISNYASETILLLLGASIKVCSKSIESMMPFNYLILCHPLLLLPSIFPSIRIFSNESTLSNRLPKYSILYQN